MAKWVGRRVFSGATVLVGAAGCWSRGCAGGVRRCRVLPSGGACPQRISRQNEKFKNWKSKIKTERKTSARAPPISILGQFLFRPNGWGARSRGAELAHLEAGRPGQLDIRRTTSVHAGNAASRVQTKARACQHNFCRASSQAASTGTDKRAMACRGASNACCVAVRQPTSSR